jgi:hypothetical protein
LSNSKCRAFGSLNNIFLVGFSGSPWTLATYMIEGGSSKTFANTKKMLFNEPKALHLLLDKLAHSVIAYLNQQILSGADSVMVFDTWGGVLSKQNYLDFSKQRGQGYPEWQPYCQFGFAHRPTPLSSRCQLASLPILTNKFYQVLIA